MSVAEDLVERVVCETSERMQDANYAQLAVGSFVQAQPVVSQYLVAWVERKGLTTELISLVFHAELLADCLRRAHGTEHSPTLALPDLNVVAEDELLTRFSSDEPALASYVATNVELAPLRHELARIALALAHAHGG